MNARRAGPWLIVAALAATMGACARGGPAAAAGPLLGVVVAEIVLPPPPPTPAVLRVTVTPRSSGATWPALLQPTLRSGPPREAAASPPPWALFPADQAATFVLRVPPALVAAGRMGRGLVLTLTASPLNAVAPGEAAPSFAFTVAWGPAPD